MSNFNELSDESLIDKLGYEQATTELIIRYRKVVETKAALYAGQYIEKDDLVQEGMLGLLSAIGHYNKEKNASFRTFADRCVENRMKNAVKKASTHTAIQESALKDSTLETQFSKTDGGENINPEEIMISKENADILTDKLKKNLSPLETEILKMFLSGYTYQQMAQTMSITPKAVDNALQRARRKLKSIFR